MEKQERINWLSILRGITIVLVIMNHVRLLDLNTGGNYVFIDRIRFPFEPLRIPTFVFVSGALLYYSRIVKGFTTIALYKDKIIRIGLPLIFCTFIGNLMQMIFNSVVKTPHEISVASFFRSFIVYENSPWPHRWYLMILLLMMTLYPFYRYVVRRKSLSVLVFIFLLILSVFNFRQYVETNWFYIYCLNKYLPFFFLGILTFRFSLWKVFEHKLATIISWVIYWLLYAMGGMTQPLQSIAGVAAMISSCILLDRNIPSIFSSFRKYIFQIYLFGIVFQAFVELVLWRGLGCPDSLVVLFYILNILVGIYIPVLISKCVERIPYKPLRLCFGLK